ncbi:MAG: hypothetical protein WKG32_03345 [Gemmatimonadaceae bacterium]
MTVRQLVARERARLSLAIVARGAATGLAIAAALVAASALALGRARWITHPGVPLAAWAATLAMAAVALWWTATAVRRSASHSRVASEIERERQLRAGSLRGALEVGTNGVLGRRAADALASRLQGSGRTLAPALQWRAWRRGAIAAVAAILALAGLAAAKVRAPDGWRAMRHPVRAWDGSLLQPLTIVNPPTTVLRGERVRLQVSAPERQQITLSTRTTGAAWQTRPLEVERGAAVTMLGPLDAEVTVVAADGRTSSDTLVIRVTDRPFVGDVAIRADFPAYLGRAAEVVPLGEVARVPRGTVLTVRGRASTALTRIALVRATDTLRLTPRGHTFAGRVSAAESGRWHWFALGERGAVTDVPAPLELEVIPDSVPRAEIVAPAADTAILADERITLRAAATDDHGLAAVTLRSWRRPEGGQALPEVTQALGTPGEAQWTGDVPLDVSARGLQPGDELHVVVTATDASPWRQRGDSRELVLRVPSMSERREMARTLADSTAARAAAAAKAQKQIEQRTGEAARSRGQRAGTSTGDPEGRGGDKAQPSAMGYESAEQAKALGKEQEQLQERVRNLQRDAKMLEGQMRAANGLDSGLARQLHDVQKLLAEALSPELAAQLGKLQEAAQRLSADDVRKSLTDLSAEQQKLREQMEKIAEMLKRAALEGAMQTLGDDAKELAKKERALSDSLARGDSAAAERARDLGEQSRDLSREIEQLAERLQREKAESGPQKLESAAKNAERSAEAMERTADREEKGQDDRKEQGQKGETQPAGERAGQKQSADKQAGEKQQGSKQGAEERKEGQKSGEQGKADGQQKGQQSGQQGQGQRQNGQQSGQGERQEAERGQGQRAASEGAQHMEQAAEQLSEARQSQINEWKKETTGELDRSIQETLQLAREQDALAQRAKSGGEAGSMRGDQSAVQQGTEKVGERLQQASGKTANISPQSQGAMGEARQKVQQATEQLSEARRGGSEASQAMEEAARALNKAAAALVKDRERAANAQTASGFAEMLQRMQEMAKQQGQLNAQSAGLLPMMGQQGSQAGDQARSLGQKQRGLAKQLDQAGEEDASGRAAEMAKEMRQLAEALDQGRVDASLLDRQQRLFRRLLDAGLSLEKEEREDQGKRESKSATGTDVVTPGGDARGRDAARYREPAWNELRGLTVEERRAVLEYFKRINADRP